ncbi:MAG TPA: TetR/AcrR family transcriptional regulator [Acidimicrobiia bacterium]|nr:TetR/AcrR family transcriptional regulator [Acidimicrobiia bacterium]
MIVTKAAEVFREKGYDAGTLEDVADALDFRRASLYYYVQSKSHLLYLIFENALDQSLRQLEEYTTIEDPAARLEALIRHRIRRIAEDPNAFTVFFDQRSRLDSRYESQIVDKERTYFKIYRDAVASAVDAGVMAEVDPLYGTQMILGMTNWIYKWFKPTRHSAEAFTETCLTAILDPHRSKAVPTTGGQARRPGTKAGTARSRQH